MLVSILHRITGSGLALVGAGIFVWWLYAIAGGAESYETFAGWATWKWALIVWIGITWATFQHTLSGLRHFVMDVGAGYELRTNQVGAVMTLVFAVLLTILLWAYILYGRGAA